MFEKFRKKLELKREYESLGMACKLKEQALILQQLEEAIRTSTNLKKDLEDDDESNWVMAGGNNPKQLSEEDCYDMIEQAQKLYYKNIHGQQIVRLYEKYGTGRGFKVVPKTNDEKWIKFWEKFWKDNKFQMRKKEIVRRGVRDGEGFLRFFFSGDKIRVRFMNPLKVKDPNNKHTYGIETDPDDIENVLNYYYGSSIIPAEEVIHYKMLVDSDVKRGRSRLEVIAKELAMYPDWMKDRMKLQKIRAVMAIIRKVQGSTVQARNIANQNETTRLKSLDGNPYFRVPEGVSIVTTKPGTDYEFKTPNLQAGDAQNDGYALLNMISAGPGFPNWMVSSDPSNSNYASTMVSEAPGVKELQDAQEFFQYVFEEIYEKVMSYALEKNLIPKYEMVEVKEKDENGEMITKQEKVEIELIPQVVFPELVHRKIYEETKAYDLQMNQGVMSKHTYASRLDLDYDEEKEMIEQEEDDEPDEPEIPEQLPGQPGQVPGQLPQGQVPGQIKPEDDPTKEKKKEAAFKKDRKKYIKESNKDKFINYIRDYYFSNNDILEENEQKILEKILNHHGIIFE